MCTSFEFELTVCFACLNCLIETAGFVLLWFSIQFSVTFIKIVTEVVAKSHANVIFLLHVYILYMNSCPYVLCQSSSV